MKWGSAAGLVERRVLRRGRWTTVLLVLVLILGAGATMAAVAGGRRAATSYDRFLEWSDGAQVSAAGGGLGTSDNPKAASAEAGAALTRIAELPQVESSTRTMFFGDEVALNGKVLPFLTVMPVAIDLNDPAMGRYKVLAGRRADPGAVGDAVVGFETAERLGLRVGDKFEVRFTTPDDDPTLQAGVEPVTVVGIIAYPGTFPTVTSQPYALLALTPAFLRAHEDRVDWTNGDLQVHLRDGTPAGVDDFKTAVSKAGFEVDDWNSIYDGAVGVRKLVRIEAGVLWLMAVVLAAAATVVAVQFFRREATDAGGDFQVLRALGMSRSTIAASGAMHGARIGAMAAAGAIAAAVAMSPLLPRGVARNADPDLGFHADVVVLVIGGLVTLAITILIGTASALLAARSARVRAPRPSALEKVTAPLPLAPAAGVRLALVPTTSGPAAPVRIGLVGLAAILSALIAVVSMQASFDRVLDRPALTGGTWDMTANFDDTAVADSSEAAIAADPAVQDLARGGWDEIQVNGKPVYAVYLAPTADLNVAVARGRAPTLDNEIALGTAELDALGVSVGDTVKVGMPDTPDVTTSAAVTGTAVLSAPIYGPLQPGEGGAVTVGLMRRIAGDELGTPSYFVKLRDDGRPLRETASSLADRISPNYWFVRSDRGGVRSLRSMRQLPLVLVALLAVMAAAALVHRLVTSSRSGRRHLAVLRSLGFTDSQFAQAGGTQGVTVSGLALVGAVPLGLLGAALLWRRIADYLAVVPEPVVPFAAVLVVVILVLVVGTVAGVLLARASGLRRAGVILREE